MNQKLILQQEVKQELKASEILRRTNVRQIRYMLTDTQGGYCARGAIAQYFGYDKNNVSESTELMRHIDMNLLGGEWLRVTQMNDREVKSFVEIADWLEERGL